MNKKTSLTTITIFSIVLLVLFLVSASGIQAKHTESDKRSHDFPRLANYYLSWELTYSEARKLAKWDLVILDMENQINNPHLLEKMREWNEDIIILAYITPQEIDNSALDLDQVAPLRNKLEQGIHEQWYLHDSNQEKLSWWPGTSLLNITNQAPKVNGQRLNDYIPQFVSNEILGSGLWDGVFYDNAWDNITYFAGEDVDIDYDGVDEPNNLSDRAWREGMKEIYRKTRKLTNKHVILMGNNQTRNYDGSLNGMMIENFRPENWSYMMGRYRYNSQNRQLPNYNVINNNTENQGDKDDYKDVRFGLVSTLLEEGYYSFDYGDQDHSQLWWYDEYDIGLGQPAGEAKSFSDKTKYQPGVWKREFENGLVVANSAPRQRVVDLNGRYEHIKGESPVNNGSIKSKLKLKQNGGRIVLKTFKTLKDIVFTNGNFARFFNNSGDRVRNGFFVFEGEYNGGDKIAHIDLNNDHSKEQIVIRNNRLRVKTNKGESYFSSYPFGGDYQGEITLAFGDISRDSTKEIIVAPSSKQNKPVKIYSLQGEMIDTWYPLGKDYSNGYSIAVKGQKVLLATQENNTGIVRTYHADSYFYTDNIFFRDREKFDVFPHQTHPPSLAIGNVNSDPYSEVVVGSGKESKPMVKIFQQQKQITKFKPFSSSNTPGVKVRLKDVDFDGVEDIITLSESISF